ncbi:MAG TPA: N-methyl-L-tryptophan oxidase [Burkholderiales bacterium]|nr:N-methyl-L-tryptophan oxidase [Burkholderiales bacterium]
MVYDAIVVGVGGMGSATLYHLARRGAKVLGLERFDIPHEMGSSHGVSRIIRLAYAEHPDYVPFLRRAYELWRELESEAGERLLCITGGIDAGAPGSATVKGSLESCRAHRLPYEVLDAASLTKRYPGYRLASDMVAVFQPDAGFLLSERCIVAHVEAARKLGAEVGAGERVLRWQSDGMQVAVETDRGTYRAKRLVITAGAWAGTLLPELQALAVPERQVVIWTQPLRPEKFNVDTFPVFNMEAPEGRFYGFPVCGVPGFKIGKYHHRHERIDPERMDRACHSEDEAVLREGIRHYFPDADGPALDMKACMFTNTPDGHFIVDVHPRYPQIVVASACSGHGFKFCSVLGEIMADLALDGRTRSDIGMFRLSRF